MLWKSDSKEDDVARRVANGFKAQMDDGINLDNEGIVFVARAEIHGIWIRPFFDGSVKCFMSATKILRSTLKFPSSFLRSLSSSITFPFLPVKVRWFFVEFYFLSAFRIDPVLSLLLPSGRCSCGALRPWKCSLDFGSATIRALDL